MDNNNQFIPKFDPETGEPLFNNVQGNVQNVAESVNDINGAADAVSGQTIPYSAGMTGNIQMPQQPQNQYHGYAQAPQQPQYQNQGPVQMPQQPQFQNQGYAQAPQQPQYQNQGYAQIPQQPVNNIEQQKRSPFPNYQINPNVYQNNMQNGYQQPQVGFQTQQNISSQPVSVPQVSEKKGFGIVSLIMGIVSVVLCWSWLFGVLFGVLGLIFGIIAKKKNSGKGMATAGIILSVIGIVISIAYLIIAIITLQNAGNIVDFIDDFDF